MISTSKSTAESLSLSSSSPSSGSPSVLESNHVFVLHGDKRPVTLSPLVNAHCSLVLSS